MEHKKCERCGEWYWTKGILSGKPQTCNCKRYECNVLDWDDDEWNEQWATDEEAAAEKYAARMEEWGEGVAEDETVVVNVRTGEALPPSKYHVTASYRLEWSGHRIES